MDLTIQIRIFNNVKYRQAFCLRFGDRSFTSLAMLGFEAKTSIFSRNKENLILIVVSFWWLLSHKKKTLLVKEVVYNRVISVSK